MKDPEQRKLQYERIKQCKLKKEQVNNIKKNPVGRPRKHDINMNL
jgi:hypothetical protein